MTNTRAPRPFVPTSSHLVPDEAVGVRPLVPPPLGGTRDEPPTGAVEAAPGGDEVGSPFPDRATWAERHRTVYADDVDKVADTVSTLVADYASNDEITQASTELGEHWRALGRDLRAANAEAVRVFPLHGHRARRRASINTIWRLRDALSPEDRAIVDEAERLKHLRHLINDAQSQLTDRGRLQLWVVAQVEKRLPAGECPTWRAIVARWHTARLEAGDTYAEEVRQRPIDESAWSKELRRRTEVELLRLHRIVARRTQR